MLNKATQSYRNGYYHATSGQPSQASKFTPGTFKYQDYVDGYRAGMNDNAMIGDKKC